MITLCSTKYRITTNRLKKLDEKNGSSHIRLIEMIVDEITGNDGYSMQFWKDMEVCGLREAILYLEQHKPLGHHNITEYGKLYKEYKKIANLVAGL